MSSEKVITQDAERRQFDILVIGEEPHVAYNRVGLSSFFEHRKIENLYLNSKEWVSLQADKSNFMLSDYLSSTLVWLVSRSIVRLPSQHQSHRYLPRDQNSQSFYGRFDTLRYSRACDWLRCRSPKTHTGTRCQRHLCLQNNHRSGAPD